jgi:hypothetical protein
MTEPTAAGYGHLVIRAGPAGPQPAGHLHEAGRNHPTLEARPALGAFFPTFPRHHTMITGSKRHTGASARTTRSSTSGGTRPRDSARMPRSCSPAAASAASRPSMTCARHLADFAAAPGLRVRHNTRVVRVDNNFLGAHQLKSRDAILNGSLLGSRHTVRTLARVLEQRGYGVPRPHQVVPPEPTAPAGAVIARVLENKQGALGRAR